MIPMIDILNRKRFYTLKQREEIIKHIIHLRRIRRITRIRRIRENIQQNHYKNIVPLKVYQTWYTKDLPPKMLQRNNLLKSQNI